MALFAFIFYLHGFVKEALWRGRGGPAQVIKGQNDATFQPPPIENQHRRAEETDTARSPTTLPSSSLLLSSPSSLSPLLSMDVSESVILEIESLSLPLNISSGSPKISKALSRKGSSRMERRSAEEQEGDDSSKKLFVKVLCSQLEQPFVPHKASLVTAAVANSTSLSDAGEGKAKRFNRLTAINPRKILLLFASVSSMGTMVLIYFTLAIYRRGASEN